MPTDPAIEIAARAHRSVEVLHAMIYFAPEAEQEFTAIGLRPGRMCYFAGRSAPMGPVPAGVTAATFYNFNPEVIARHIPRAWELASATDVVDARFTAVDRALRRMLTDEGVGSPAVAEAAELARAATVDLPPEGRPLFAAHAGLDWPAEPHLVLWHAVTLLREFRGDGHVAALLHGQLSGLDALITHTTTGRGFTQPAAQLTRGWSPEQWAAGEADLRERGLFDSDGLSSAGIALRQTIEQETDRLAAAPWRALGPDRTARLIEVGRPLSATLMQAGAFPPGTFARADR